MKFWSRIIISLFCAAVSLTQAAAAADLSEPEDWGDNKFSMFIHFGLYSHLGGVWNGEIVEQGYSEQIQSFAGIFSDRYANVAEVFDPVDFDADGIAALAKRAGMRSVIFTSKHHDGFCMFDTETTDFNSVRSTSSGRDYVKELSDACQRAGLNFGLYFSLIDWHSPYGAPISSHNADKATPQLHNLNMAQVRELVTSYGRISELWFDMGSMTPQQSRELYDLVKRHQPGCMVSGRLGNDCYDFAVMGDNKFPSGALQSPWQSAASMFNETWSWRSWQERGSAAEKAAEKLRSLIKVTSHGGNYLLNIGPDRTGAVIPFEREVLEIIGGWLKENGDAIYETEASPFREDFGWGCVTKKGHTLNLILCGEYPQDGIIRLPLQNCSISCSEAEALQDKRGYTIELKKEWYDDGNNIKVIKIQTDKEICPNSDLITLPASTMLSRENAAPDYSYSCFDYYSNYRSTTALRWSVSKRRADKAEILYTAQEAGKSVTLSVNGVDHMVLLDTTDRVSAGKGPKMAIAGPVTGLKYGMMRKGAFETGMNLSEYIQKHSEDFSECTQEELKNLKVRQMRNIIISGDIICKKAGVELVEIEAGNGVEVVLNGETVMMHLNPYGTKSRKETVVLNLKEGRNEVIVRLYNRFESHISGMLQTSRNRTLFRKTVTIDTDVPSAEIKLWRGPDSNPHTDGELHNFMMYLL
ncbi:MAG: alpha-L-fucosidase [Bacteroidales bacterium]|nr:alpha-L-fucosidase [Bacteroidales bacterium]